ncbi:MAG: response regulator [Lewinellaceae bacterium]|nr:response regulator [Lewinellaceae bacterium]
MKKHLLLLCIACFSTAVFAQKTTVDSLLQLADRSTDRNEKLRLLHDAGLALEACKPFPRDSVAVFTMRVKKSFSEKEIPQELQAVLLLLEGKVAARTGEHESALGKLKTGKKVFEKTGEQRGLNAANVVILSCLSALGRSAEAIELAQQVLETATAARDTALMTSMYMSLGHEMVTTRQFSEAEDYQKRALLLSKNDTRTTALVQFYLGNLHLMRQHLDSSVIYFEKAATNFTKSGDSANVYSVAMQLCTVWQMLQHPEKSGPWCEKAARYFEIGPDLYRRAIMMAYMAQQGIAEGDYQKAIEYARKAAGLGEKTNNRDIQVKAHRILADAFSATGRWEEAYEHLHVATGLHDSLQLEAWNQQIAETEARFRTREQKATIAEQQLELEREKNSRQVLILIGLILLILIGSWFVWQRVKQYNLALEAEHTLALERARAEKHAESDQLKSTFLANISHEFRTPLTLIIAPLKEMRAGTFRGDLHKYYGIMERNAKRLLQLVNELLDLARLESGSMELRQQPGDLVGFLRPLAYSFESLAGQKQIRYRVELPAQPVFVYFDRDKLEKIALNLLSNAFKFTPEEGEIVFTVDGGRLTVDGLRLTVDGGRWTAYGRRPMIDGAGYTTEDTGPTEERDINPQQPAPHQIPTTATRNPSTVHRPPSTVSRLPSAVYRLPSTVYRKPSKPCIVLKVRDNGIGLSPEHLSNIFNRFYRVETDGNIEQVGSGIGLALTKELVELHGGEIMVESPDPATGKGSVFTVVLPLEPATVPEHELPETPDRRAAAVPDVGSPVPEILGNTDEKQAGSLRPGILIVEDNADVREYIAGRMRDHFDILECTNGREGLEMAFERMPDLILSDIMMPGMDGLAFLEKIKNDPRTCHIPVVLLTAKAGLENRLEGLETGADAYLVKPFDARELDITVNGLLQKQQVMREKYSRSFRLIPEKTETRSMDEQFLFRIKHLIEENMDDEALSVETLAAAVALSRTHLYRKLQALTGKSPNVLIRELRLERARQLLEQGAGNASEIAFRVGFSSLAYFSKCFTGQYGVPPSEVLRASKGP